MKKLHGALLVITAGLCLTTQVRAQITAFSYSGQLDDGGAPATGSYVFRFTLYDSAGGNTVIAGPILPPVTGVTNGAFTLVLDFGNVFDGSDRWLQIEVHTNDNGAPFTTLNPRTQILPTPYAITASHVSGTVTASQLTGTLPSATLSGSYGNAVSFNNSGNIFRGDGSQLTAVSAATVADGSITAPKFAIPSSPLSGQVLSYSGSALSWITPSGDGSGWGLSGTTISSGNFLGTINNLPLELRVYNHRALQILPSFVIGPELVPTMIGGSEANQVIFGSPFEVAGNTIGGGGLSSSPNLIVASGVNSSSTFGTISGGAGNNITNAGYATIGGGYKNRIFFPSPDQSDANTIAGGYQNSVEKPAAGGQIRYAFIGSGLQNINASEKGVIGGGYLNLNQASEGAFIGSGQQNAVVNGSAYASIVGGEQNRLNSSSDSFIGGGNGNLIEKANSDTSSSVIGGGFHNLIAATRSFIGGGLNNTNQGGYGFIGGGEANLVSGAFATIPGGDHNLATGNYAFAAGRYAKAMNNGAFVWADGSGLDFSSTANNQFLIRAAGNVGINKNNPATALDVNGTVTATHFIGDGSGLTGVGGGGSVPDGSITAPKFAAALPASGQVLSYNGSALAWTTPSGGGSGWLLSGNAIGVGDFLGSINNSTVELRANNLPALRIIPGGATGTSTPNLIGGDANNSIAADVFGAVIGGGAMNKILSANGVISGGAINSIGATAADSSVLGGFGNQIASGLSVIGGGQQNFIRDSAGSSFLGGGQANNISTNSGHSVIVGGNGNQISEAARQSFIGGGKQNLIESADALGFGGSGSVIGGGLENNIRNGASLSHIGGGYQNEIGTNSYDSVIGGGVGNKIWRQSVSSVIAGGLQNEIESFAYDSTIGGGSANKVRQSGRESVIAGGVNNEIGTNSYDSTIGGGFHNLTHGTNSTIAGGYLNQAIGGNATVAGGYSNQALGDDATVNGGSQNTASGIGAIILGGQQNFATNDFSTASGQGGVARMSHAHVEGVMFANPGDGQGAHYVLKGQAGGEVGSLILGPEVPVSGAIAFSALISAKQFGDASAGFEIKGVVRNYGGSVDIVSGWTMNVFGNEIDFIDAFFPVIPTHVGNRLAFRVVALRGSTVRWVISLTTAEVVY